MGRDTKFFLARGFSVEATDGPVELCHRATELTGIEIRHELFQDLSDRERYDGIWACSSILHVSRTELSSVLDKMRDALKPRGIAYSSFKYGSFEGERNGRHFTDLTEALFHEVLSEVEVLEIEDQWITGDVRPARGDEKWLNCLLCRR